jgi:hypothetical protein
MKIHEVLQSCIIPTQNVIASVHLHEGFLYPSIQRLLQNCRNNYIPIDLK